MHAQAAGSFAQPLASCCEEPAKEPAAAQSLYRATITACEKHKKPYLIVEGGVMRPSDVVDWVSAHGIRVLNIAGNRESKNPGLGERVERFFAQVFTARSATG
jgi:hypothetical protein